MNWKRYDLVLFVKRIISSEWLEHAEVVHVLKCELS